MSSMIQWVYFMIDLIEKSTELAFANAILSKEKIQNRKQGWTYIQDALTSILESYKHISNGYLYFQ